MLINTYVEKIKNDFKSQHVIAKNIGIKQCSLSLMLNGKGTPSPETVLKLAELAGEPKEKALLDFFAERYAERPVVAETLQNIKKNLTF